MIAGPAWDSQLKNTPLGQTGDSPTYSPGVLLRLSVHSPLISEHSVTPSTSYENGLVEYHVAAGPRRGTGDARGEWSPRSREVVFRIWRAMSGCLYCERFGGWR